MALGRTVLGESGAPRAPVVAVNTRNALWPGRWPAIALQACVDTVEAAPVEDQVAVKRGLPCKDCPEAPRCLTAKRKELGPILYDREIQTRPRSQESTLFPFELFAPMLNTKLPMVSHYRKTPTFEHTELVVSGWDLAWSEKVGGDRLVRCTALLDLRRNKRRLLNILRYPMGLRYTQQCALIEQEHQRFNEDLVVIESDAAQIIWAQGLEENTGVPVFRHTAGDKQNLAIGVPGLLIDFDNQRWEFPYLEDGPGFEEMQALLAEFEAFGWNEDKLEGVGEHDDLVMGFWHCSHGLKLLQGTVGEFHNANQPGRYD